MWERLMQLATANPPPRFNTETFCYILLYCVLVCLFHLSIHLSFLMDLSTLHPKHFSKIWLMAWFRYFFRDFLKCKFYVKWNVRYHKYHLMSCIIHPLLRSFPSPQKIPPHHFSVNCYLHLTLRSNYCSEFFSYSFLFLFFWGGVCHTFILPLLKLHII